MIPLILKINNFLSYGNQTQTINFAPYKLICLSGKNGHGKSALLDALTWALWGQARKVSATSKPDQGLVHLGEVEMMVSLDFIFNNEKFRVKRNFSQKYGKPHTHVEFGMLDSKTDRFISLTDKTIRKTEEKIIESIGLDYDTFINTCFLRQGQSNEFSKKSAKERKEILSTILGLGHYDQTRKFILESSKELQQKIAQQEYVQQRIAQEIEVLHVQVQELEQLEKEISVISHQEKELLAHKKSLTHDKEKVLQKEQEYTLLATHLETLLSKQTDIKAELYKEIVAWRKTHKVIISYKNNSDLHSEKKLLEERSTALQKELHTLLNYKEKLLHIKTLIAQHEGMIAQSLHNESETIRKNIIECESVLKLKDKQYQEYQQTINHKTALLTQYNHEIQKVLVTIPSSYLLYDDTEIAALFEKHKSLYRSWIERANKVKQEITETHHKQELSDDHENPSCPLCEQNLSQSRKRFLQKKLEDAQHTLRHRFNRLKNAITRLKDHLQEEYNYIQLFEQRKKLVNEQNVIAQELEKITHECALLQQERTTIAQLLIDHQHALQKLLESYTHKQRDDKTLHDLYQQEKELDSTVSTYQNILQEYQDIQKKLDSISSILLDESTYKNLVEEQHKRYTLIMHLKKERTLIQKEYYEVNKSLSALHAHKALKIEIETVLAKVQTQLTELASTKQIILEKKAVILHAQEKIHSLEKEKHTIEEQRKVLTVRYLEEQTLAQAFSKDGIQALLIEQALPELEYEANDLLARLTDNQAHISIESLRDLKKGGTRETLDINISDAQGVRPYELFSGGEAFRIDFALRIAISKLLARRAGTSLQTLIIDEGFGSQDDDGLNRIMDSIYTIQEDFEKIIIVSHLSAMKEQFPVHFVVSKKPQGSVVTVIEND